MSGVTCLRVRGAVVKNRVPPENRNPVPVGFRREFRARYEDMLDGLDDALQFLMDQFEPVPNNRPSCQGDAMGGLGEAIQSLNERQEASPR